MELNSRKRRPILMGAAWTASALGASTLQAATADYFTASGPTATPLLWNTAANWSNGLPGTTSIADFNKTKDTGLAGGQIIDTGTDQSIYQLALGDSTYSLNSLSLRIQSNTITLAPAAGAVGLYRSATGGAQQIQSNLTLGVSQTWSINGTAGSVNVSGVIGDGGAGYNISKQAGGTLQLQASNTFTGYFTARGGITTDTSPTNGLGLANTAYVSDAATTSAASLFTNSSTLNGTIVTVAQKIVVQSNNNGTNKQYGASLGAYVNQTAASFYTGEIDLNQPTEFSGGSSTVTFSGNIVDGIGGTSLDGPGGSAVAGTTYNFVNSNITVDNGGGAAFGGTVIFSGANTYSGSTTITSDTLLVNGSNAGNALGAGAYAVNSGGTLGGTGSIKTGAGSAGLVVANGGFLSPGTPTTPGTFTVTGDTTLDGTLSLRVGDSGTDVLNAVGLLSIQPDATLNLSTSSLTAPVYVLADYSTLFGSFANVTNLPANYVLNYDYNNLNEVALVSTGAVPEPATIGVLLLPAVALMRRRKNVR